MRLVEEQPELLAFLGRLALNVDKMRGVRHRLEDDDEFRRELQ